MRFAPVLFLIASLAVLPFMITDESLWLDEGSSALFAMQPDLRPWWNHLSINITSDAQMPLYMFCIWSWEKVAGSGEWQLRALNLVWGAVALTGVAFSGRRLKLPWLPLLLAAQPFFWLYMNEARPYLLHLAAGSWMLAAFVAFLQDRGRGERWAICFGTAAVVLCYATMLAPVTIVAVAAGGGFFALSNRWPVSRRSLIVLFVAALMCLPAGWYYVTTLQRGAKGAELWTVGAAYLPYVVYELAGFTGLGPAVPELRNVMKGGGIASLWREHGGEVLALAVFGLSGMLLLVQVVRLRLEKRTDDAIKGIFCVVLIVAGIVTVASYASQKAFWARHYAAVFPFYVAALGWSFRRVAAGSNRWPGRALVAVVVALSVSSSLSLRFAARHRKEDYRTASSVVKRALADGEDVWWIAAPEPGAYYGIPLSFYEAEAGRAFSARAMGKLARAQKRLTDLPLPDLIVMSRPDAFDPAGAARGIIDQHGYHRVGGAQHFEFYRR